MLILDPRQVKAVPAPRGQEVQVHWDYAESWWVIHGEDSLLGYSHGPIYLHDVTFGVDEEMRKVLKTGLPPEWPVFYITGTCQASNHPLGGMPSPVEMDVHDGWVLEEGPYFRLITTAAWAVLQARDKHSHVGPGVWARR